VEKSGAHAAFWKNSQAKDGPDVASIHLSQKLIMNFQLTELFGLVFEGQ